MYVFQKQVPVKRRSNEKETDSKDVSSSKNTKYEASSKAVDRAHIFIKPEPKKPSEKILSNKTVSDVRKTPEKTVLDKSVVNSLVSIFRSVTCREKIFFTATWILIIGSSRIYKNAIRCSFIL